jgi:hypothetical protein
VLDPAPLPLALNEHRRWQPPRRVIRPEPDVDAAVGAAGAKLDD